MSQLFFKKQFQTAILAGTKTTTIRRWPRPRVVAGRDAYSLGIGWLSICSVERIELPELDDQDARADGFADRSAMLRTLARLYPSREDGSTWFRIRFQLKASVETESRSR